MTRERAGRGAGARGAAARGACASSLQRCCAARTKWKLSIQRSLRQRQRSCVPFQLTRNIRNIRNITEQRVQEGYDKIAPRRNITEQRVQEGYHDKIAPRTHATSSLSEKQQQAHEKSRVSHAQMARRFLAA